MGGNIALELMQVIGLYPAQENGNQVRILGKWSAFHVGLLWLFTCCYGSHHPLRLENDHCVNAHKNCDLFTLPRRTQVDALRATAATIRLAGRYATRDNHPHFKFFESIPDTDSLRSGDSTVDELFLRYTPTPPMGGLVRAIGAIERPGRYARKLESGLHTPDRDLPLGG